MVSINTNLSSIISQKSLNKSTNLLNQAIERMSTGYKVNHASDNAANYSISNDMTSKISSYMVAEDNTSMGLDMVSTAADTLDTVYDRLSRIRSLAEQAANGTYGEDSIKAIKSEVQAHVAEIKRVMTNTEYNGMNVFDYQNIEVDEDVDNFERITPDVVVTDPRELADALSNNHVVGIANAEVLDELTSIVNSGKDCSGQTIVLTDDIDLSGRNWHSIGNPDWAFKGTFDGNGYTISNLFMERDEDGVGLFGYTIGAEIRNLTIKDCDVTGCKKVGGLVGGAEGTTIENCYVTGKVEGNVNVGGLAGWCAEGGAILNSYSSANISGDNEVGGLVGLNGIEIIHCYATGNVSATSQNAGGLVGANYGAIVNSYASGNVSSNSYAGGLAGINEVLVVNCYASGDVTVVDGYMGLFGENRGEVQRSTYVGTATARGKVVTDEYTRKDMTKATMQVGIYSGEDSQIGLKFRTVLSGLETISTRIGSSSVLDTIDGMLSEVSNKQTEFGAAQNRLESALESISVNYENLVSSRSTLRDADIAKESSKYIQQQILQQAAATLLSTANQSPAIALQLI